MMGIRCWSCCGQAVHSTKKSFSPNWPASGHRRALVNKAKSHTILACLLEQAPVSAATLPERSSTLPCRLSLCGDGALPRPCGAEPRHHANRAGSSFSRYFCHAIELTRDAYLALWAGCSAKVPFIAQASHLTFPDSCRHLLAGHHAISQMG